MNVAGGTINKEIALEFTPIIAPESCWLTEDRDQVSVNGPGNGVGFLVGKECHQRELAKAIHHGEHAVGGGVRVAKLVHAIQSPDTTWAGWKGKEFASPGTLSAASGDLALEAVLGKLVAVLLQVGPEVLST